MSQGFGVRNGTGCVAGAQCEGKEEGRGARSRRGVSPACHATGFGSHPARDGGAGADRARGGTRSVGSVGEEEHIPDAATFELGCGVCVGVHQAARSRHSVRGRFAIPWESGLGDSPGSLRLLLPL